MRVGSVVALGAVLAFTQPVRAQATRDSAGIRIVENRRPLLSAARAWRVEPRAWLQIGRVAGGADPVGQDTVYELLRVMGVARLSDGRIAVANQGSHTVRFYDARGRYLSAAGREGDGPAEFRQILAMKQIRGDTLFVYDLGEIEFFTGDGKHVRRGERRIGSQLSFVYPSAILGDGSYGGPDYQEAQMEVRMRRGDTDPYLVPIAHVTENGLRLDTVGFVAGPLRPARGQPNVFRLWPIAGAAGDRLVWGVPERYELRTHAVGDGSSSSIRRRAEPVRVEERHRDAFRRYLVDAPGEDGRPLRPEMRARREQQARNTVFPEHFPYFSALLGDRAGNLWVRRYDYRDAMPRPGPSSVHTIAAPSQWDVFDGQGRWVCTVELPASFTPLEIGGDYMAGVWRNEDDVEHVRFHRLIKP
jgi:hypothetical protein